MPHRIDVDRARERVVIRYDGLVTAAEYVYAVQDLMELMPPGTSYDGVSVFVGADLEFDLSQFEESMARLDPGTRFDGRHWAYVVESERHAEFAPLLKASEPELDAARLFTDEAAAAAWLDSLGTS